MDQNEMICACVGVIFLGVFVLPFLCTATGIRLICGLGTAMAPLWFCCPCGWCFAGFAGAGGAQAGGKIF